MATHVLVQGGQRARNLDLQMFPGSLSSLSDDMQMSAGRPATFGQTRVLDFNSGSLVLNSYVPENLSPESYGSAALRQYMRENEIAEDDVLQVMELPKKSALIGLHYDILAGVADLEFSIQLNGRGIGAGSSNIAIAGTLDGVTTIDGSAEASAFIWMPKINSGNPYYLDGGNDVVEVVMRALTAGSVGGDGLYTGGIEGFCLAITPIVMQFDSGAF